MSKRETENANRLARIKARHEKLKQENESQQVVVVEVKAVEHATETVNTSRSVRFEPRLGYSVRVDMDEAAKARIARIVGKCINVRLRMVEFEDGSHGRLWVRRFDDPMLNWVVWVKPDPDHVNDWIMHGTYNPRGIRTS